MLRPFGEDVEIWAVFIFGIVKGKWRIVANIHKIVTLPSGYTEALGSE